MKVPQNLLCDSEAVMTRKVSQNESEKEDWDPVESIVQMLSEMFKSQENTLQGSVEEQEKELSETHPESDEMRAEDWEVIESIVLQLSEIFEPLSQENTLRGSVEEQEEVLSETHTESDDMRASEAESEKEDWDTMEVIVQLESEMFEPPSQENTLQGSVKQEKEELSETHTESEDMWVSQTESEKEDWDTMESIVHLESEMFEPPSQENTLQGSVKQEEEELSETPTESDDMRAAVLSSVLQTVQT
ncbi:uncharacterized protein Hap1MRO34_003133 [Clarias gariepinus]